MKTTNVENYNPVIASLSIVMPENEKGVQDIEHTKMTRDNIKEFPLPFPTEAQSHTCKFDADKKEARREYNGKIVKANFNIMKQARNTRKKQGRKIESIEEYKASKKLAKVSGMEIGD